MKRLALVAAVLSIASVAACSSKEQAKDTTTPAMAPAPAPAAAPAPTDTGMKMDSTHAMDTTAAKADTSKKESKKEAKKETKKK